MSTVTHSGALRTPGGDDGGQREPQFRYAVVLGLMLVVVVFLIAAPATDLTRGIGIAGLGAALVVTVGTSRERESVRRRRAVGIGVAVLLFVVLIGLGVAPFWLIAAIAAIVTAAVPVALVRGLLRLISVHGVTLTAVAGSLAIYMSIGVMFAWVIGFVAQVSAGPYFAQHTDGTQGEKVYYSFTVLTTTGFGDFTPLTPAGHAIAVIEMLTGQLYLVTVIGLLIGNFAAHRGTS